MTNNVEANIVAANTEGVGGEVFNIACGDRYTLLELVQAINRILGTNIEPILGEERKGEVKHSLAGIEKAKEMLGYTTQVSFYEGLEKTVAFMLENDV